MNRIRKYLIGLCVLATAMYGGAGTAVAMATPGHAVSHARNTPCDANYYQWAEGSGDHMWRVYWTRNPADCWIQGALRCHNRNGTEHWFHGGRVTAVGLESGVNCDAQYPEPDQGNMNFQQWPVVNPYYYRCLWSC